MPAQQHHFFPAVIKYGIRNNIYETADYKSDTHVVRDGYQNLSLFQKIINGLAQISLAALSSALIHAGIVGSARIFFKTIDRDMVKKFTIIGALIGAILGALYEPKIGDFYYYQVLKNPYTRGSKKYM